MINNVHLYVEPFNYSVALSINKAHANTREPCFFIFTPQHG